MRDSQKLTFIYNYSTNDRIKIIAMATQLQAGYPMTPQLTLVIKSIDSVDAGALMISSEKKEVLRVLDLVG